MLLRESGFDEDGDEAEIVKQVWEIPRSCADEHN